LKNIKKFMVKVLTNKFNYFRNLKFVRDVFTLQVGSFFGTAIALVASVIFARVLGAEVYGNYALIFAFTALVGIFMDWGIGYATITLLSEAYANGNKDEVKDILTYFLKVSLISVLTVGFLAIILAPWLTNILYHQPQIGNLARLILIAVIIRTFFSLLVIMLQVLRKIRYLTVVENINKLFLNLIPAIFVLLGLGLWGIVWGHLLTTIVFMFFSLWVYFHFSRRNKLVPSLVEIYKNFSKVKVSKYFKFGFTIAVDKNIANSFAILPLIFLGFLGTPEQVANLKIAIAYLTLPKIFLGPIARLLQVQLPKAKAASARDLKSNFYKSSFYTGIIFIILTLGFLVIASVLIKFLYGREFIPSINLVYVLSLSTIMAGFAVGYSSLYRTMNKMKTVIAANVTNLVSGLALFIFILQFMSPLKSVITLIIYWALFSLVVNFFLLRNQLNKIQQKAS
tara:strand:+ start:4250 stop:5608 length:1359 start_codon:yes stop_codon:yes gene_type:complete